MAPPTWTSRRDGMTILSSPPSPTWMPMLNRRSVGQRGEDIAADYLRGKGYRVLQRNVRSRYGEIDIVAALGDCLVFVEVRTVQTGHVIPEESVGPRKQRQIGNLAIRYLQQIDKIDSDWRTDV